MVEMNLPAPYQGEMNESREDIATQEEALWEKRPGRWAHLWEMTQIPMEMRFQQLWEDLPPHPLLEGLPLERIRLMQRLWQEMLEDKMDALSPMNPSKDELQSLYQQMIPQVMQIELEPLEIQNLRA